MSAFPTTFRARIISVGLLAALSLLGIVPAASAQGVPVKSLPGLTTEQKVDQLVDLMGQDDVRTLLSQRLAAQPQTAAPDDNRLSDLDQWASKRRDHLARMVRQVPAIPGEISQALNAFSGEIENYGWWQFFLHVGLLLGAGLLTGLGTYRITTAHALRRQNTGVSSLALATVSRRLLPVLGYGLAATVMFFAIQWSPVLSAVLLPWLAASIGMPFVNSAAHLVRRVVDDGKSPRRQFWLRRSLQLITVTVVFWAMLRTLGNLGVSGTSLALLSSSMIGLVFMIGAFDVWQQPDNELDTERRRSLDVALTFYLLLLFGLWTAGTGVFFWAGLYALVLPGIIGTLGIAARKAMAAICGEPETDFRPTLADRSVRLIILAAASIWLIFLIRVHPGALPGGEMVGAIAIGLLHGVLVLLFAGLLWMVVKTLIARRLEGSPSQNGAEGQQNADDRSQTLLPILRNMSGILIGAVAIMTVLSEFGVDIGPLLASAGIFGIAIGFGSQTLVKDIISGAFYMVDDAFRVGEYIQSGSYKGTVESFSIRSVKLRHHRGPIYTVPFGSLGAVENMSRDWSIDKFLVTVAFDTDLAKVRKITKEIGSALKEDPEFGPLLIETVKLKGVEQFGEYGMTLGFGMMVKPSGQQSMIRRKAYAMLKDAFENNGIEFATMTGGPSGKPKPAHEPVREPSHDT